MIADQSAISYIQEETVAQKVVTEVTCDISGEPAEETVQFAVNGQVYEIDLATEPLADFRSALGGFVESARPVGKLNIGSASSSGRRSNSNGSAPTRADRDQLRAVREWARNNGMSVSDRGRISAEVQQAFAAAHQPASVG